MRTSDLRIRNLSLVFNEATGEVTAPPITTELRTDIFDHWLRIAEKESDESVAARQVALDAPLDDDETFKAGLLREFETAMMAMMAAAFALDSFYASVVHHAPDAKVDAKKRYAKVYETLKRAFALTGPQFESVREPLRVLFVLRGEAVHPSAAWAEPILHPVFNLGMEPRFVKFRAENAVNGQLLARSIIFACLRKPKRRYLDLVAWCESIKDLVPEPPPTPDWALPDVQPADP